VESSLARPSQKRLQLRAWPARAKEIKSAALSPDFFREPDSTLTAQRTDQPRARLSCATVLLVVRPSSSGASTTRPP